MSLISNSGDLSDVALRTVVASTAACLLTSAIAGMCSRDS